MNDDVLAMLGVKLIPAVAGLLFVAEEAGTIAGPSGWAGAGLLGLVLCWLLLKHLPEKDRQQKDFIDSTDARFEKSRADFLAALEKRDQQWQAALDKVIKHCETENDKLRGPK